MVEPARTIRLEEMTWRDVRARIDSGCRTVILPLGATEQHGPHLPLCVDNEIAGRLALAVAERLGDCLVAPVLPIGCSAHHLAFAGSMSLGPETLAQVVTECCDTLGRHGFERVLVISGHAGNVPAMKRALEKLAEPARGYAVDAFVDWGRYREPIYGVGATAGLTPRLMGSHAGHYETSLMLRMRPELVRLAEAVAGYLAEPAEAGARLRAEGMHNVSPVGVIGDPRTATAQLGDRYFEAMAGAMVAHFNRDRPLEADDRKGAA